MANILILSKQGDGVPIALKLVKEGHKVDIYLKDKTAQKSLKGYSNPTIVSSTDSTHYDLILADMVGMGKVCEDLKSKGNLVLGGGLFQDKLELDREYGAQVVRRLCKIKEPNSVKVNEKGTLLTKLKTSIKPLVIKPLGNKTVDLTLVSLNNKNQNLISIVEERSDEILPCLLQEKIDGLEISTEGWFNGETFIHPFNHTFEKKRLMEYDKGPQTGCMGNVVWVTKKDRLVEEALLPLTPLLKKVGYVGPIDVNCILKGNDAYFLEWTTRFGYDAIQAFAELLKIPLYDFLFNLITKKGDLTERRDYINDYAMAVRLSLPPYPNKGAEKWSNIQAIRLDEGSSKHVWLADVCRFRGREVIAGVDGVIGCVTAKGPNMRELQRRVYRTINNIIICKDIQFRNDIGVGFIDKKTQFEDWCQNKPIEELNVKVDEVGNADS